MSPALLEVRDLQVAFQRRHDTEPVVPVTNASFDMRPGERVGLVGESGSGKSLTALAVMGLIPKIGGELGPRTSISLSGEDLRAKSEREMRWIRGGRIAMIFQDPLSSLNPVLKTGRQVIEALELHRPDLGKRDMRDVAVELLDQVHLPRPERLMDSYPHELSGGMRQRVMIAIALAGDPDLLIADEPTTALDVTIQAGVLDLLHELGEARDLAVLLITHDLSIIAGFTHRVLVMYGGRLVERAPTRDLYADPRHPYTGLLLRSIPPLDRTEERLVAIAGSPPEPAARPDGCGFNPRCPFSVDPVCTTEPPPFVTLDGPVDGSRATACARVEEIDLASLAPAPAPAAAATGTAADEGVLVEVERLSKTFKIKGEGLVGHELITAVDGVSLELRRGEVLGIVGESGSGKSTLARCMLHLIEPSRGTVRFDGQDLGGLGVRQLRRLRLRMQMIFQDPASSLDPRMRVGRILAEPLRIHGLWGTPGHDEPALRDLIELVQLPPDSLSRFPHEFSGGQRQRIAIARSLTARPSLLVCDEPVSALDVSVRSSILNLLADLREEFGLTMVFIAHDLSLVRYLCDRIGVMHRGRLVELKSTEDLFADPVHDHTTELLAAQPVPDPTAEQERRARRRSLVGAGR
ncbi:MAG: ABC transporter ATP-binding protein [Acidimicrobiaceae bacterium]|nr:ABC transporter ATP-binding protein [Acidimicrobiaceae bacterium]